MVWKLRKTVYGLVDASRGFYLNLSDTLKDLGCTTNSMDPAMFIFFDNKSDDEFREPRGLAITHVDDILSVGDQKFKSDVRCEMKKKFKFGGEEEMPTFCP